MFVRRVLALTLLLTLTLAAAPAVASPDFTLTAHRGAPSKQLGENTLPAFGRALADGATAIETDLRRTKDDKLVVLHDSGVGRTTNCSGPIGSWTLRELSRKCREHTTRQPVLTAKELLGWAERSGASLMLELKGSNWSIGQIRAAVDLVKESDVFDQVAISSLRLGVLERVNRLAPRLDTQLIVSGWHKVRASLGKVEGYNVPASSLTRNRVRRLQRKGIVVVGGQADSAGQWQTLARLEVDGVVTPSIRRYQDWAR
ncbi:glycerophosphodiester phosphodiesterase [Nocardioides piscis]|uniref:Glycerophosphodiester phosphodiesterase n=1 Tax=Nocardioides piscis TaxID=2714938 RepID=A0A6G7YCV9_9ACTN|nr:glycerophosphodiester phosphodiesterase [Nocardioides piscis]QIK74559.1 glycerophosphodiester phosphodiesterase [Nocardioides piscis]